MSRLSVPFTAADLDRNQWANCGPTALAVALGITLEQVHPLIPDIVTKGYASPTMMYAALNAAKAVVSTTYKDTALGTAGHRKYAPLVNGVIRTQFAGKWTELGQHPRFAYFHTHWSAMRTIDGACQVWDVNAMDGGHDGWLPYLWWSEHLVPWLIKETTPRASGDWWITHAIEITSSALPAQAADPEPPANGGSRL